MAPQFFSENIFDVALLIDCTQLIQWTVKSLVKLIEPVVSSGKPVLQNLVIDNCFREYILKVSIVVSGINSKRADLWFYS